MNWKDIKKIIKKELKEATEEKYIVVGSKGEEGKGPFQYGPSYDSKEKAQAVADKKNKQSKYKATGISFSVEKGSLKEELKEEEINAGGSSFNLRMGVNKNKTKLGIKIQFEPKNISDPEGLGKYMDLKPKLEVALQERLNKRLGKYKMQISKDTDVPRDEVIGFFIPLSQLKALVVEGLGQGDATAPDAPLAPEPEGENALAPDDEEIEEMINGEMINEMLVRELNQASKIIRKEDFYDFINAGNNIIRDMEAAEKSKPEAKKYLKYLVQHNIQ